MDCWTTGSLMGYWPTGPTGPLMDGGWMNGWMDHVWASWTFRSTDGMVDHWWMNWTTDELLLDHWLSRNLLDLWDHWVKRTDRPGPPWTDDLTENMQTAPRSPGHLMDLWTKGLLDLPDNWWTSAPSRYSGYSTIPIPTHLKENWHCEYTDQLKIHSNPFQSIPFQTTEPSWQQVDPWTSRRLVHWLAAGSLRWLNDGPPETPELLGSESPWPAEVLEPCSPAGPVLSLSMVL